MGKRSQQQFRTRLVGTTALTPGRVFEVATAVADQAKGGGMKVVVLGMLDAHRLHLELRSTGMGYALRGINAAGKQGGVTVVARPIATGTDVLVHLDGGITSQSTVMLVPVTTKKMIGFEAYSAFLSLLDRALKAEDGVATVAIRNDEHVG